MNKAVELVRLWGEYEQQNPDATIEGFCRNQLSASLKIEKTIAPEWQMRPDLNGGLVKLISRIGKFHIVYTNKALEGTGLDQISSGGLHVQGGLP